VKLFRDALRFTVPLGIVYEQQLSGGRGHPG
jgi:hypothetical protein